MYMKMLEIIGQEEKVDFKAEDVRDCLLMLNELICLYDGSHMMQIEPNWFYIIIRKQMLPGT